MHMNSTQPNYTFDNQNFTGMSPYSLMSPQQSWATANNNYNANTSLNTNNDRPNPPLLLNSSPLLQPQRVQSGHSCAGLQNCNSAIYPTNFENIAAMSSPLSGHRINDFEQLLLASPNIAIGNTFGNINQMNCPQDALLLPTKNASNAMTQPHQISNQTVSIEGGALLYENSAIRVPMLMTNISTSEDSVINVQQTNHLNRIGPNHRYDFENTVQLENNIIRSRKQQISQTQQSPSRLSLEFLERSQNRSAETTVPRQINTTCRQPQITTTVEPVISPMPSVSQAYLPKQILDTDSDSSSESLRFTNRCFKHSNAGNRGRKIQNCSLLSQSDLMLWWPGSSRNFTMDNNGKLYILQEYTPVLVEVKDVSAESDILEKLTFTSWNDVCHRYKTLDKIKNDQTAYDHKNPITYHCGYCGFGFRYSSESSNGYNAVLEHMNGSDDQNVISHCTVLLQILSKNGNSTQNISMKTPIPASRFDSKTFRTATLRSLIKNPHENPIAAKKAKKTRENDNLKGKNLRK